MPKGPGVMTRDERLQYVDRAIVLDGDEGFEDSPVAQRGASPIEWENRWELEQWRKHVGQRRAILPVVYSVVRDAMGEVVVDEKKEPVEVYDEAKTKSLMMSVKNRLMTVFADESWSTHVGEDSGEDSGGAKVVYLVCNGHKGKRTTSSK